MSGPGLMIEHLVKGMAAHRAQVQAIHLCFPYNPGSTPQARLRASLQREHLLDGGCFLRRDAL